MARVYAEKWATYQNVIWQLGLRGIADRPMWMADPDVPQSDADRVILTRRRAIRSTVMGCIIITHSSGAIPIWRRWCHRIRRTTCCGRLWIKVPGHMPFSTSP